MSMTKIQAIFFCPLVMFLISCALPSAAGQQRVFFYEPTISDLEGTVRQVEEFGPPNFGESPLTDKKITVYFLLLDTAVTVKSMSEEGSNLTDYADLREIQLIGMKETDISGADGRHCQVRGTLFEGISGHHYAKVVMTVRTILCAERQGGVK